MCFLRNVDTFHRPAAVCSRLMADLQRSGIRGKMEDFHFVFPWRGMAASVFSVLLIVFITMMYAVSRLKRENIIDALRDDMT